ncbi:tryptophan-rich sensory protein [Longimicrobium terrae]|uniref:Uncharacterized membrane protein YjjP (DUF1212 family) n=1 Tax=Longimicrobium terrae TaxID=1639882 RepID=A0A841H180_9BACT|nr:tryptophan-rich sensory protein [Longimicrobium terrae]MBB4637271.1 hypothetical protein [Longimicrobium terrae]MBB6071669.1 uncharacterized membrane protein YjjP (DUF1212 family) [Longimicrobium terrae]NNC28430.1 tryptophan-rich sensory protein [Longimicrobium terrae]
MKSDRLRQWANVLFSITQIAAPAIPAAMGLPAIGEVSNRYPTYVVPAGYAFSIWSLIFLLTVIYAVWQALPAQRAHPLLRRVGWLTAAAMLGNTVWELVFPRGWYALSVLVIAGILASLIVVIARTAPRRQSLSATERALVWVTFSIFLGWITVATVANVAGSGLALGWTGAPLTAEMWGIIMIAIAGGIAAAVTWSTGGNAGYALTVVWALVAVFIARRGGDEAVRSGTVAWTAAGSILLILSTLAVSKLRARSE